MADNPATPRRWRPTGPSHAGRGRSNKAGPALVAAILAAVAGVTAAWLFFPEFFRRPHFLALCLGDYGDKLPVRAWVRQDGEALSAFAWQEHNAFANQKRDLVLGDLRDFLVRAGRGPVVIYLNACALPSPKGELCLVPVDAPLGRPDKWVPLRDVFAMLRDCPARHKLLLVDVMQPLADPSRGLLADDAADRLQALLDEVLPQDTKLSVLSACSAGQVSLPAEEQGHSVFAHFLCQGLHGQAEGHGPTGRKDGRVSLGELAAYVSDQVDRWAVRHRGRRQTPQRLGAQADFPLVIIDSRGQPAEEAAPESEYPPWLRGGWELRDSWWSDETYRRAPDLFLQLESALMRADRQWRGGIAPDLVQHDLDGRMRRLKESLQERPRTPPPAPRSAAAVLARDDKAAKAVTSDAIGDARRLAGRSARLQQAAKPDADEVKSLDADVGALVKPFKDQPAALAKVLFEAAAEEPLSPAALRFLSGQAEKAKLPSYTETDFLARVAKLSVRSAEDGAAVHAALQVVREAEQAALGDERAQPWVRQARQKADAFRRAGEKLLFGPDEHRADANGPFENALKAYRKVNGDLRTVEVAQRRCDQARVLLPGLAALPDPENAWHNVSTVARQLQDVLAAPVAPAGAALDEQIQRMAELTPLQHGQHSLSSLLAPLAADRITALIGRRDKGKLSDAKMMTDLLETPRPTAEERVQLTAARREMAGLLESRAREVPLPPWDARPAQAEERRRALERASRSVDLLYLQGAKDLGELDRALRQAEQAPADEARLRQLADALRGAWERP
jgi:hypothetical protein